MFGCRLETGEEGGGGVAEKCASPAGKGPGQGPWLPGVLVFGGNGFGEGLLVNGPWQERWD